MIPLTTTITATLLSDSASSASAYSAIGHGMAVRPLTHSQTLGGDVNVMLKSVGGEKITASS